MGTSNPAPIKLVLNVNMPQNSIVSSVNSDTNDSSAAPISSFIANAQAMDSNGKDIPVDLQIQSQSIQNNEKTSEKVENSINHHNEINIDNNLEKNKNNIKVNDDKMNNFSLFDEKNTNEFNKGNNIDKNIAKGSDANYIDKNQEINNDKNNNDINNKNDKNNFLKEGVRLNTNFGEEGGEKENEKEKEEVKIQVTDEGKNIDNNLAKNKNDKNELFINGKTPVGENIDINQGSSFDKSQRERDKDNYLGNNYSKDDLSLSQSVYLNGEESLSNSIKLMEKGYLPIFMKLNDYPALLLHIKEEATLKSLVKAYIRGCPETDEGLEKDIKLYNNSKNNNEQLDMNKEIKYLGLSEFNIITNKIGEIKK